MRRWPLLLIACAGCGKSKAGAGAGQRYEDAVAIVCHADDAPGFADTDPAQRAALMSKYVAERVTNPDVLAMIDQISHETALGRRRLLHDAIVKAVQDTCPALEAIAPWPVPDVGAATVDTLEARGVVVITEDALLIADTPVVTLKDFVPADGELDGDTFPELAEQIAPVAAIHPGSLTLIVDPRAPYHLVFQVINSVKAHYHRFALTATSDTARGMVPIIVPDAAAPPPSKEVEQMVVGLTPEAITLFSLTGREGTLDQPALRAPLTDLPAAQTQVQDTLGEIVKRRWDGKTRTAESRRIVLLSSDDVPASAFVPILAALRMRGDALLYPDVMLGAGLAEAKFVPPTDESAELVPEQRLDDDLVQHLEETRGARTDLEVAANVETSLTDERVSQKIHSVYLMGLKRCYKQLLAQDPTAQGSVELAFTVTRNGRVADPRADADWPGLADCYVALMKKWTFPIAVDADGDTREPEFTIRLRLQTDAGAP